MAYGMSMGNKIGWDNKKPGMGNMPGIEKKAMRIGALDRAMKPKMMNPKFTDMASGMSKEKIQMSKERY